jgi:glutamate synthase (NADPH/NADH) large chain
MVGLEELDREDAEFLHDLIERHHAYTGSQLASRMLHDWKPSLAGFVKVMPNELRRVLSLKGRLDVPA